MLVCSRGKMESFETRSPEKLAPLLENDQYVDMNAMDEEEEEVQEGPIGQTASLLYNFRVTVGVIFIVLVGIFVAYAVVNTSDVHGLGLNTGKHSCLCEAGWQNTNTSTEGVCNKPAAVDRGSVSFRAVCRASSADSAGCCCRKPKDATAATGKALASRTTAH